MLSNYKCKTEILMSFSMFLLNLFLILPASAVPETSSYFPLMLKGVENFRETACKHSPNYQVCISTLQIDSRSSNADITGLTLSIVEAIRMNATAALEQINKLKNTRPDLREPLITCSIVYHAVVGADVPVATEALTEGVPKFAEHAMVDAAMEAQLCEDSFKDHESPLSSINKSVHELSLVAISMITQLL